MIGNLVASAGYDCDYFGKWHIGTKPENAGYLNYDNVGIDNKKTGTEEITNTVRLRIPDNFNFL